jgi:hypothetical protein
VDRHGAGIVESGYILTVILKENRFVNGLIYLSVLLTINMPARMTAKNRDFIAQSITTG